jgi:hypothetical protein
VAGNEVSNEYNKRLETVSSTVTNWNEEHKLIQGSKMDNDEEIYKEIYETPCIAPRIVIRDASPSGKTSAKKEEKRIRSGKLLAPLRLMNTFPVKLQRTSEMLFTSISSRDSGRPNSDRLAYK